MASFIFRNINNSWVQSKVKVPQVRGVSSWCLPPFAGLCIYTYTLCVTRELHKHFRIPRLTPANDNNIRPFRNVIQRHSDYITSLESEPRRETDLTETATVLSTPPTAPPGSSCPVGAGRGSEYICRRRGRRRRACATQSVMRRAAVVRQGRRPRLRPAETVEAVRSGQTLSPRKTYNITIIARRVRVLCVFLKNRTRIKHNAFRV